MGFTGKKPKKGPNVQEEKLSAVSLCKMVQWLVELAHAQTRSCCLAFK